MVQISLDGISILCSYLGSIGFSIMHRENANANANGKGKVEYGWPWSHGQN